MFDNDSGEDDATHSAGENSDNLRRSIPGEVKTVKAKINTVALHAKINGGTEPGIFETTVDYHLEHADGSGVEKGSIEIKRERVRGKW